MLQFSLERLFKHRRHHCVQFRAALCLEAAELIHFRLETVEVGDDAMPSTIGKLIAHHPQAELCDLTANERRWLINSKYSVQAIYEAHRKERKGLKDW